MAYSVSLVSVRTEAFQRCALEHSDVVTIPEANAYINKSGAVVHDKLAQACGEKYVMNEVTFATQAAKEKYNFVTDCGASDFMALQGVDQLIGGKWLKLRDFKFSEREKYQGPFGGGARPAYRFHGASLVFAPIPTSAVQTKLSYTPTWDLLVADTDTFDTIDGWEEFVIVDTCIKMLVKQDLPCEDFKQQKAEMIARIDAMKLLRNTAEAPRIVDVNDDDDGSPFSTWGRYGA